MFKYLAINNINLIFIILYICVYINIYTYIYVYNIILLFLLLMCRRTGWRQYAVSAIVTLYCSARCSFFLFSSDGQSSCRFSHLFFLWSSLDVFPVASAFFSCFSSTSVIFPLLSTVVYNCTKLYNWTNALNSFLMRCYIYSRNILSGCLYTIWTLKLRSIKSYLNVQHYACLNVLPTIDHHLQ